MNVREAPPAPKPPAPSFARRHPFLAGFGALAALSLFAAYWPASAIITGIVVACRATGADRAVLAGVRRGAAAVVRRLRRSTPPPDPGPAAGPPVVAGPPARGAREAADRGVTPGAPRLRAGARGAPRPPARHRPARAAAPRDRGLS